MYVCMCIIMCVGWESQVKLERENNLKGRAEKRVTMHMT